MIQNSLFRLVSFIPCLFQHRITDSSQQHKDSQRCQLTQPEIVKLKKY